MKEGRKVGKKERREEGKKEGRKEKGRKEGRKEANMMNDKIQIWKYIHMNIRTTYIYIMYIL